MPISWTIALIAMGILALLLATVIGKTKGARKTWTWLGVIILGIGMLGLVNVIPGLQGPLSFGALTAAPLAVPGEPTTPPSLCAVEDTTVTLNMHNKYTISTGLTAEWARVFVNGADLGLKVDGATFTASPYDNLRIIFGENSSTYYSVEKPLTIPCAGTKQYDIGIGAYDSSPTVTLWLEDGSVMSSTNAQVMTTDSTYTLPFRVRSSAKTDAGSLDHPGLGNIWCVHFNQTEIDKVEVFKDGIEMQSAKVPRSLAAATGFEDNCYYTATIGNSAYADYDMLFDTASTQPSSAYNATYYLYDVDIDLDADTLVTINDVEDEDFNDLGYTSTDYIATGTIYYS